MDNSQIRQMIPLTYLICCVNKGRKQLHGLYEAKIWSKNIRVNSKIKTRQTFALYIFFKIIVLTYTWNRCFLKRNFKIYELCFRKSKPKCVKHFPWNANLNIYDSTSCHNETTAGCDLRSCFPAVRHSRHSTGIDAFIINLLHRGKLLLQISI